MRPHQLTFGGIGAYAGNVEIDFDQLGALGLYLIVGPTGAGKTTIFDAMTYALFGRVAGERPVSGIISDHSHRVAPYVALEFSHRENRYSIHRVPTPEGKTSKTGDHFITKTDANGAQVETITGLRKVTEYVTELIGLEADQFMKVILLPQNEFQKFLLANSTEKMPLLRALFGTHLYESIAFKLDGAASAMYAQAKSVAHDVQNLRNQINNVVSDLIALTFVDYDEDSYPETDVIISDVIALSRALQAEASQTLATYGDAQAAFAMGTSEQKRFDAAQRRDDLRRLVSENAEAVERARRAIDAHQRAVPVVSAATAAENSANSLNESVALLGGARKDLADSLNMLDTDEEIVAGLRKLTIESAPALVSQEIMRASEALKKVNDAYTDLDSLLDRLHRDESQNDANQAQLSQLQSELDRNTDELKNVQTQRENARVAELTMIQLSQMVRDLDNLLARSDVDTARTALSSAQADLDVVSSQLAEAEQQLGEARRSHTQHLAGDLAQQLVAHEPCPVCGSREHPTPAPRTTDVDVATLEKKRDDLLAARAPQEGALIAAQQNFELTQEAFMSLPPSDEQVQLREQLRQAQELVATLPTLDSTVQDLSTRIAALTGDISTQKNDLAVLQADISSRRHRSEELLKETSALLARDKVSNFTELLATLDSCAQALTTSVSLVAENEVASRTSNEMLTSLLKSSNFASADDALAAVLNEANFHECESMCELASDRENEILTLDGTIGDSPVPSVRPDIESLRQKLNEALEANTLATQRSSLIEHRLQQLIALSADLNSQATDADALQTRATNAVHIAKIIKAGTPSHLSLERWVQRQLFEEVCDVASVQIASLTSNKYQLTLNSDGAKSAKRSAGLDIFVIDSHTGKTRSVSSLSGGEQFLTSLALSLALAEVVQRHSGGVEISTLFIDEGFGSLDGDSLDLAVDVLRSLQDTGRTVGVISHVESMQQELHVGIRVSSSPIGSSLQVLA